VNKAGLLFVAIAGGYVLFELSMLHRLGYRMEADHILEQMASAAEATALCATSSRKQRDAYNVRFDRLLQRALRERADRDPQAAPEQLLAQVEAELEDYRATVGELVRDGGCESEALSTLLRRYTIYAGRG
jgi:hypothetical protein